LHERQSGNAFAPVGCAASAENLVKQFFVTLQRDTSDWIWLTTTKTGILYHLTGSSRKGHE
jgi:hypothetical protein